MITNAQVNKICNEINKQDGVDVEHWYRNNAKSPVIKVLYGESGKFGRSACEILVESLDKLVVISDDFVWSKPFGSVSKALKYATKQ
jgi:hypothetical protein